MEVKKIRLRNIGRFSDLEIALAPLEGIKSNVTVFVGNNGSGKTSILRSLATSLSWLVSRIQSEKGNGSPIPELVIKNCTNSAALEISIGDFDFDYDEDLRETVGPDAFSWTVVKARKGHRTRFISDYSGATKLGQIPNHTFR